MLEGIALGVVGLEVGGIIGPATGLVAEVVGGGFETHAEASAGEGESGAARLNGAVGEAAVTGELDDCEVERFQGQAEAIGGFAGTVAVGMGNGEGAVAFGGRGGTARQIEAIGAESGGDRAIEGEQADLPAARGEEVAAMQQVVQAASAGRNEAEGTKRRRICSKHARASRRTSSVLK